MNDFFLLNRFFNNRSERDPDKTAVYEYDSQKAYTYSDLAERSSRLAVFFKSRGLKKGDRAAMFCRNFMPCIDLLYAMPLLGTIITTYNVRLKAEELGNLLLSEKPSVVLYESLYAEKVKTFKEILPDAIYVVVDENNPLGDIRYNEIMALEPLSDECCAISMEDILMLCHTGGTTGTPKAAKISYGSLFYNTLSQVIEYGISASDKIYVSYPLFHISAWSAVLSLLEVGGTLVFKKDFDTEETLRMIETEKLTFLNGSPAVYQRMALSPQFEKTNFSSIRFVRCGAAPPPVNLVSAYLGKGLKFIDAYGMTESGTSILSMPLGSSSLELIKSKPSSAGKPMLFTSLRIVDELGNDVPIGESGELLVKGAMLFSGYWQNDAETAKVMENGWLHTGDVAVLDEDGYYTICGRKKHMYISLGENIFPLEIENFLIDYPEIDDCYVFGVPDYDRGEVGKAIIVLHNGCSLTEEEVQRRMKGKLSTLKIPKYVQFVEKVPRNEVGKVQTKKVRELYGLQ